jgi:hypothetical protein
MGLTEVSLTEPVTEKFPLVCGVHFTKTKKKGTLLLIRSCIKHWQEIPQCEKG